MTSESRKEQKELHQNRLDRLKAQEQAQRERAEIETSYRTRIQVLNHHREQSGDDRAWLTGFIALLDSDAGRYFDDSERAERRQQAQALLAELEPLPEPPDDKESLFFSALEAIGRGEDPLTKGIERKSEELIKISYEHFPEGTEQVLNALSHIDNTIGTMVEFFDDRSNNWVSSHWHELDENT